MPAPATGALISRLVLPYRSHVALACEMVQSSGR
jgi:hypothetical protein